MTQLSCVAKAVPVEDGWQKEPKLVTAPNGWELAARDILGKDDRWEVYAWNVVGPDVVEVTGAVPTRISRTGRRSWRGKGDTVCVSDANMRTALLVWEEKCGSCATCGGDGREAHGWSKDKGYRYQTCSRCGGSGKPPKGDV